MYHETIRTRSERELVDALFGILVKPTAV